MTNKEILKKQIFYRSAHRGSKEMDILLGGFVEKYIQEFNDVDLKNLQELLLIEDEVLYNWYFNKKASNDIPKNRISEMLKQFKL